MVLLEACPQRAMSLDSSVRIIKMWVRLRTSPISGQVLGTVMYSFEASIVGSRSAGFLHGTSNLSAC